MFLLLQHHAFERLSDSRQRKRQENGWSTVRVREGWEQLAMTQGESAEKEINAKAEMR